MQVDHVGIAVRDLDGTIALYRDLLGVTATSPEQIADQKVRAAFVKVGATDLEFLEPTDPSSAIARFLENRGEGMHHLALQVPDVNEMLLRLEEQGRRIVDRTGRLGARGRRVGFAHPSAFRGVLVEFVEVV